MPIHVAELNRAVAPLDQQILGLLERDPSKAYALGEIVAVVLGYGAEYAQWALWVASSHDKDIVQRAWQDCWVVLQDLRAAGRVQQADVRGATYFAAIERS